MKNVVRPTRLELALTTVKGWWITPFTLRPHVSNIIYMSGYGHSQSLC